MDIGVTTPLLQNDTGYPDQLATAITPTYIREPLWCYCGSTGTPIPRMRKGTCRWMGLAQGMSVNQTTDSLKWISLSSLSAMVVVGPWDGVTTPTF
jgi:hypothetical protein